VVARKKTVWVNPRLFENAKKNLPKGVTISTAVELILNAQREGKITSTDPGKIKERSQVALSTCTTRITIKCAHPK